MNPENYPDFFEKGPASCTYTDPEIFFTDPKDDNYERDTRMAKLVCSGCKYTTECLEWALEANEPGVWGGTTDMDRRKIKRNGRRSLPIYVY